MAGGRMKQEFHLTKNDNADISFASTALIAGVISFDEFKEWLYLVIQNDDSCPSYVFDIIDLESKFDYTLKMGEILGFIPSWELNDDEEKALDGIGYKRFSDFSSDLAPRQVALAALERNPQVEARFRETFPFITI